MSLPAANEADRLRVKGWLERAVALYPHYPPAHASLSSLQAQLGQDEAAIGSALQAAKLSPENLSYRLFLARMLARASRTAEALQVARDALPFAKTDAERGSIETLVAALSQTRPQ
jgi:tetratricopeptide (TPR) repeat protein